MKNFDRFTEPDNYIDQSGRLIKLKWFALIAAVGIVLLFFLSGCESILMKSPNDLEKEGYLKAVKEMSLECEKQIDARDSIIRQLATLAVKYHDKTFYYQAKLDSIYNRKGDTIK